MNSPDSSPAPAATKIDVAIVGAGPAGLMAAEVIAQAGWQVTVLDASASAGRKFLLAGKGGLNLTHSEALEKFIARYHGGDEAFAPCIANWLNAFGPQDLRNWCHDLGVETFVGSSGRVFPLSLKAAPLLRAWLHRLRGLGVRFAMKHRWTGWDQDGQPSFLHQGNTVSLPHAPRIWLLALGGGSWPHLGSDGHWIPLLRQRDVQINDLAASNCGFEVVVPQPDGGRRPGWSPFLRSQHGGAALKNIAATIQLNPSQQWTQRGEILLSDSGIEGNLVYAASSRLRQQLLSSAKTGVPEAILWLNLLPAIPAEKVHAEVARPRGPRSWSTHLKSRLGLDGAKMALLHELLAKNEWQYPQRVAESILALPITLGATRPMAEAISTAGGIQAEALTPQLELTALPSFYCAGEMLDWDAPTGGYLLTACLSSGRWAGHAIVNRLSSG